MIAGWTTEELIHEAIVAQRRAMILMPDTELIDRPDWFQVLTPSLPDGVLNEIGFCALDDGEADEAIDKALARYRDLGLRFRWKVVPGSRPADLSQRLERRGLHRSELRCMARTTDPAGLGEEPSGVTVEEIDEAGVEVFSRVMAEGWNMDQGRLVRLNRTLITHPKRHQRFFLARADGEPAATGGLVLLDRSAYLIGGLVLRPFRGRGLYRALVAHRLELARDLGLNVVTTQSIASTSGPILERLGFETFCSFDSFTSHPRRT